MEDNAKKMKITVLRYRPEQDKEPWEQTFEVPYHQETSVLEALFYIKDNFEPSLSFRWSCRMAVCGSCGMMVNGVPHLACKTFLRDYEGKDMKIEPLANFPIERDLVVDLSDLIEKMRLTAIAAHLHSRMKCGGSAALNSGAKALQHSTSSVCKRVSSATMPERTTPTCIVTIQITAMLELNFALLSLMLRKAYGAVPLSVTALRYVLST